VKIAVLGLGRMGRAIAGRLLEDGHDLTVWNRSAGRAGELVESGATEARSAEDAVAGTDVALTSLADDAAVHDLVLRPDGLSEALGDRPYADTSTVSPELSGKLAARFEQFIALPVLGAPQLVRDGRATWLAGGDGKVINGLRPMLDSLGGQVKRFDRPEQAATAKLALNLLLLSGVATMAESLALARSAGLSDFQLTDLFGTSPMLAPGLKSRFPALVEGGTGPTWWTTALGAKDASLATEAAAAADIDLVLAPAVRDRYRDAADGGLADEDIVAVARLYG
jgi:3-hydroxyisobutyrate dehydrogenase